MSRRLLRSTLVVVFLSVLFVLPIFTVPATRSSGSFWSANVGRLSSGLLPGVANEARAQDTFTVTRGIYKGQTGTWIEFWRDGEKYAAIFVPD